jgi:hypothetical protein
MARAYTRRLSLTHAEQHDNVGESGAAAAEGEAAGAASQREILEGLMGYLRGLA